MQDLISHIVLLHAIPYIYGILLYVLLYEYKLVNWHNCRGEVIMFIKIVYIIRN